MNHEVDTYINRFEGTPKAWLRSLVGFMRAEFPEIPETISYGIPMYRFDKTYVAFSAAKTHIAMHTLDFDQMENMKYEFSHATFGKGCVRVEYDDEAGFSQLFTCIRHILKLHDVGMLCKA